MTIAQKFREAIKAGDMTLAKTVIEEGLTFGLTDQDRGAMLVSASLAYMKLVNEVNDNYNQTLKEIIQSLKDLKVEEKVELKGLEMEKVRAELNA